jgi:hypothetical protein
MGTKTDYCPICELYHVLFPTTDEPTEYRCPTCLGKRRGILLELNIVSFVPGCD